MTSLSMMRAVTLKAFGGVDNLAVSTIPRVEVAKKTDVLIKVMAAGVNRADLGQRQGTYPPPKKGSELLGLEVSGVVASVGPDVKNVKEGDKVMALLPGGGYAEYAVAHYGSVMPVPQGYSFIEAAAIPEAFLTAWQALKLHADVRQGQNVLIHAGASGVGTAAAQLVEKYFKATAVTTSSAVKMDICKNFASINIDRTADETGVHFARQVKDLLGEASINAIIDPVFGGNYITENAAVIAEDGRIVVLAFMGGSRVHFNALPLFRQRASLIFSRLRSQSDNYKKNLVDSFSKEVLPFMSERIIVPTASKTFSLDDVAQAHLALQNNNSWGKIILSMGRQ